MYPSIGFFMRKSRQEYTIPGTEVTIDKGVAVIMPIQAMQNDERFFDNPKEFRPERFHPDNMDQVNKYVYMPFAEGPRICIGEFEAYKTYNLFRIVFYYNLDRK